MPATFLAAIEESLQKRVVDHFDMIVGTSTGGIIALGLGLGIPARSIADFYIEKGPEIFGDEILLNPSGLGRVKRGLRRAVRGVKHLFAPKHDAMVLQRALAEILQERRLGDSETRLVVPAYNSMSQSPHVFKTAHHQRFSTDHRILAVDVALATAAAPTYFRAHNFDGASGLVDGGIWANNPMGIAAVEASAVLGWDMANVWMLSLGCSEKFLPPKSNAGIFQAKWVLELMFRGQDRGSIGAAKLMLGHPHTRPDAILRVNPELSAEFAVLDDASIMERLSGVANDQARHHLPKINDIFFDTEREPFVPFHKQVQSQ